MARGKQTCKILKDIRRQIAEANGIEFITSECRYKGDCRGTCPKCEAEVRYLEQQLRARSLAGKAVVLAGISAGMILMSGCGGTKAKYSSETSQGDNVESSEQIEDVDEVEGEPPLFDEALLDEDIDDTAMVTVGGVEKNVPTTPDGEEIYICSEQPPQFPGGPEELLRFINRHIKYPEKEAKDRVQDHVVVKFYVDTLGHVCEPEILEGKYSALNREALRVVSLLPNFIPGINNGNKVNVYFQLPITFNPPELEKAQ